MNNYTARSTGNNRKTLLALEKKGEFVFHGSPDKIEKLRPKQAFSYNEKIKKMEKDGGPAVFATPYADIAIFRALINNKVTRGKSFSKFGIDGDKLNFSATKNLLDSAKKNIGKVYILDKKKFREFKGMQCRCNEIIFPLDVIEVSEKDLPNNINIVEYK